MKFESSNIDFKGLWAQKEVTQYLCLLAVTLPKMYRYVLEVGRALSSIDRSIDWAPKWLIEGDWNSILVGQALIELDWSSRCLIDKLFQAFQAFRFGKLYGSFCEYKYWKIRSFVTVINDKWPEFNIICHKWDMQLTWFTHSQLCTKIFK